MALFDRTIVYAPRNNRSHLESLDIYLEKRFHRKCSKVPTNDIVYIIYPHDEGVCRSKRRKVNLTFGYRDIHEKVSPSASGRLLEICPMDLIYGYQLGVSNLVTK